MRHLALLLAACSAASPPAAAATGHPTDDGDTGHRAHFDPVDVMPWLGASEHQTYHPHPHWHGRAHRRWKAWVRAGKPRRRP